ncbi:MAG TPA: site-2 protease family protein, partial [Acidimicrobiales bacterium]|nr:site-2 protease family protein [Acidimicrobiales bacterium]
RDGRTRTLTVVPADGRLVHEAGVEVPPGTAPFGVIGVTLGSPLERRGALDAVGASATSLGRLTWASVVGVGHLFSPGGVASRFDQVTSAQAANQATARGTRVESIYGAARTAVQAAQAGVGDLLVILISINVFVGVFNLFPMLPLDGGHVAIAVYERIRSGRRSVAYHADVAKLLPFTWLMVAFLGVLFATSLLNDLVHPPANPFG